MTTTLLIWSNMHLLTVRANSSLTLPLGTDWELKLDGVGNSGGGVISVAVAVAVAVTVDGWLHLFLRVQI